MSIHTTTPPATDPPQILQRADEVHTVLRMLGEPETSVIVLVGNPGAGKSVLAALVYRYLETVAQAGPSPLQHFIWLRIGPNATLPDIIAAILERLDTIFQSAAHAETSGNGRVHAGMASRASAEERQIVMLMERLRHSSEGVFIVLDQFDELLDAGHFQERVGRGAVSYFLRALREDLGACRFLLTGHHSPYSSTNGESARVRSYLVSRVSIPEGVALLQQRGVVGAPQELSLVWQRCAGHVYALILFSALSTLSGFALSYLLDSPDYVQMWRGEVTLNLLTAATYFLNPVQRALLRALCLFTEPATIDSILAAMMGEKTGINEKSAGENIFTQELAVLANLGLVQRLPEKGRDTPDPYMLHALVQQFMMAHYLDESIRRHSGNTTTALGVAILPDLTPGNPQALEVALAAGHIRVAASYANLAQSLCPPRGSRSGFQDVEPLLAQIVHLCLGWRWQEAYDRMQAEGLHACLLQWGAWNRLIRLYTAMIPPYGVLTRRDEGQVRSHLGFLYGRVDDYAQSQAYYEQALAIQREVGDRHGEAVTLANQGETFRERGEAQLARANFEQALTLNQQEDDPHLKSVLLHNLGLLAQNEKDYAQAFQHYVEALKLAHRSQEQFHQGTILTNMGMLLYEQGRVAEALKLLSSALRLRLSLQDPGASSVMLFLTTLEKKMGIEAFARLSQGL
jgi:tetratricopeptide (TPR) repeat protein